MEQTRVMHDYANGWRPRVIIPYRHCELQCSSNPTTITRDFSDGDWAPSTESDRSTTPLPVVTIFFVRNNSYVYILNAWGRKAQNWEKQEEIRAEISALPGRKEMYKDKRVYEWRLESILWEFRRTWNNKKRHPFFANPPLFKGVLYDFRFPFV